ncbi:hypothetical protein H8959_007077 [Pygathrix nigripes]
MYLSCCRSGFSPIFHCSDFGFEWEKDDGDQVLQKTGMPSGPRALALVDFLLLPSGGRGQLSLWRTVYKLTIFSSFSCPTAVLQHAFRSRAERISPPVGGKCTGKPCGVPVHVDLPSFLSLDKQTFSTRSDQLPDSLGFQRQWLLGGLHSRP